MDVIDLTRELLRIPSPTGEEGPVVELVAGLLREGGWQVRRQPVSPGRDNLYATRGSAPEVVFSTHLDVVPPHLPVEEDETWLRGRGSCDAKGIAAAMMVAAGRLFEAGESRIGLLFLVGEEDGSDGALAAASLEPRGRFLVNGEPTEGALCIGQKGALRAVVRAHGKEAHSAYPEEGRSAVHLLLDALERIRRVPLPEHPVLGECTLNVGLIEGGVAPNVLAPQASASLLVRTVEPSGTLRSAFSAAVAEAGLHLEISFPLDIPPALSEPLPGWDSVTVRYTSDLPLLASWGRGYQLGPGTIRVAHTPEERIRKSELREAVDAYVRLARDLLLADGIGAQGNQPDAHA